MPERRPGTHVVVVNRWRERYALYDSYLDHRRDRVTYVTTDVGRGSVPDAAAAVEVVHATDDLRAVTAACDNLVGRFGPPGRVLALKEDDLLVGAALRERYGCPGPRADDIVPFRDKALMCAAIRDAGLPVPAFAVVGDADDVLAFGRRHGWPVIVKPRCSSSGEGVELVTGPDDLDHLEFAGTTQLAQVFCDLPIHHVDGLFDGEAVRVWRGSSYINDCLGFRTGTALGSVEVDDPVLHAALGDAAERCVGALTTKPTVFHLELFVDATDASNPTWHFLEVGARTGGAEIPFIWREVHGYDLVAAATAIQLGRAFPTPPRADQARRQPVAGWLLVPAPAARPCRITGSTSMLGKGPYAEAVLQEGEVLPAADSYYEHVGGRFRFRGLTATEVEHAILATAAGYHVAAEPIGAGEGPRERAGRVTVG